MSKSDWRNARRDDGATEEVEPAVEPADEVAGVAAEDEVVPVDGGAAIAEAAWAAVDGFPGLKGFM